MDTGYVTTPFGRRPMTLAMVADHIVSHEHGCQKSVDKWALYRALCQAKPRLGLSDRTLAVLNALLSFYPKAELASAEDLIVFPSNQALSLRTHGMAEQTVRRHIAALVEAGLLLRKDSPNGKRYARRSRAGEVRQAFGFSLAPLLQRAEEIADLADKVEADRHHCALLREEITLHRRDIDKLLSIVEAEGVAGDWRVLRERLDALAADLPRKPDREQLQSHVDILARIHTEIVNILKEFAKTQITSGRTDQIERHIESKPESRFDSNSRPMVADTCEDETNAHDALVPLALIGRACPNVATLLPTGEVRNASDLLRVQPLLCSMLSINQQLLEFAVKRMGALQTAATIACLYEKGDEITSPGGYLRNLAGSAETGGFSVRPMLLRLAARASVSNASETTTDVSTPAVMSRGEEGASLSPTPTKRHVPNRLTDLVRPPTRFAPNTHNRLRKLGIDLPSAPSVDVRS